MFCATEHEIDERRDLCKNISLFRSYHYVNSSPITLSSLSLPLSVYLKTLRDVEDISLLLDRAREGGYLTIVAREISQIRRQLFRGVRSRARRAASVTTSTARRANAVYR